MTSTTPQDIITKAIDDTRHTPVLIAGSGLSIRYLGLPSWGSLMDNIANLARENFTQIKSGTTAKTDMEKMTKAIDKLSTKFHSKWFKLDSFAHSRSLYERKITEKSDPMKFEIAKILSNGMLSTSHTDEIDLLKTKPFNLIITTNYDQLFEKHLNHATYRVFKTQSDMLLQRTHEIEEIYKIHGCITEPSSIIITSSDYKTFKDKFKYLSAKITSTLLERPIIFMGYGIKDDNIETLLSASTQHMTQSQVDQLAQRIIIVEFQRGITTPQCKDHSFKTEGNIRIDGKLIQCSNFSPIYETVMNNRPRVPAEIIKALKTYIYEVSISSHKGKNIIVYDDPDITDPSKLDILIGLGISAKLEGYRTPTRDDLIRIFLTDPTCQRDGRPGGRS